jgi:hypothetical protein
MAVGAMMIEEENRDQSGLSPSLIFDSTVMPLLKLSHVVRGCSSPPGRLHFLPIRDIYF